MIKKKVPMRKCTGCQEMKNKKELIRVVRTEAEGSTDENPKYEYVLDTTGKKAGRGAYVCKNIECLEKACKNKGLERSFKSAVPKNLYEELKKQLEESNE